MCDCFTACVCVCVREIMIVHFVLNCVSVCVCFVLSACGFTLYVRTSPRVSACVFLCVYAALFMRVCVCVLDGGIGNVI